MRNVSAYVMLLLAPMLAQAETPAAPAEQLVMPEASEPFFNRATPSTFGNFGGVGLLQTPTARFAPDGEFSFFLTQAEPYNHYGINAQVLPWFEFTFHYTRVDGVFLSTTGKKYVDKGFDVKFRLLEEQAMLPAVALGFRDVAGTGLFDSEFLVASKSWGDVDLTAGLAWGNMAEAGNISNPLCSLLDVTCTRPAGTSGTGGQFEVNRWFRGQTSLFGGVAWHTPWQPLTLVAEVEGNDYRQEALAVNIDQKSPLNVGAHLRLTPSVDFRLGYERGETLSLGVVLHTNFHALRMPKIEPVQTLLSPVPAETNGWQALDAELARVAGYTLRSASEQDGVLRIEAEPSLFRNDTQGRSKALAVLAFAAPESAQHFAITEYADGLPQTTVTAERQAIRRSFYPSDDQPALVEIYRVSAPDIASLNTGEAPAYVAERDPIQWGLAPYLQQGFGGIEEFYAYEIGLSASASATWHDTVFEAAVKGALISNFDRLPFVSTATTLPEVRTRIRQYVDQPVRLEALQVTQPFTLTPEINAHVYGGMLELMFGGVGSEVLYRPVGSDWGIGVDANVVRQRDPENALGFLPYETFTGHVTAYKHWPNFFNLQTSLAAGRYLAGDLGATLSIGREFNSGVVFGAFAAKTNVSSAEFGEGSFNKGLFLSIPLDVMSLRHSRTQLGFGLVPIQRDGGQMLSRRHRLWGASSLRAPQY